MEEIKPSKICKICKLSKSISMFYKNKGSKFGVLSECKDCQRPSKKIRRFQHLSKTRFGGNRLDVLERDNWSCVKCGMGNEEHLERYHKTITIDHIDGRGSCSKEKNNNMSNLQTLCLSCHLKKDRKLGLSKRSSK